MMPSENQPFETFPQLLHKNLATSESLIIPFKSFIAREQSFINQISDYMHAPGKAGFFPHSFLGNTVALLNTRLNEQENNAKKIYYHFDEAKTLKLVVATTLSFEELVERDEFKKFKFMLEDAKKENKKIEDLVNSYLENENKTKLKLINKIKHYYSEIKNQDKFNSVEINIDKIKDELKKLLSKIKEINHIHKIIFTEDIKEHYEGDTAYTNKFEFTKQDIKWVIDDIKKHGSISTKASKPDRDEFTLVEVLKNNYVLKNPLNNEPKDVDVKSGEVYIYKKNNFWYFKARNILNIVKVDKIEGLNTEFNSFKKDREYRSAEKFKIKRFLSTKGYHCKKNSDDSQEPQADGNDVVSVTENNVTVRVCKKGITKEGPLKKSFKEIIYRLEYREIERPFEIEKYTYLEDYITKLSTAGEYRIKDIFDKIIYYVQQAHSDLKIDEDSYGSGAREANQHGFLVGIFQMDRYRDNIRIFIEQLAGRGLADTILLILGPSRVSNSIPILIEHKAGKKDSLDLEPSKALSQSKEYAKGLSTNRIRFLTTAQDALCVGINLDYKLDLIKNLFEVIEKETGRKVTIQTKAKSKIDKYLKSNDLRPSKESLYKIIDAYDENNKRKTKEEILGILTFNSEIVSRGVSKIFPITESILDKIKKQGNIDETKKHIEEQLERVYYSFPGTRYGQSNHCFSRFLLGYSSIIDNSEYRKYAFIYNESSTIKTDNSLKKYDPKKPKDESHAASTIVFIPLKMDNKKIIFMNIIEGNDDSHKEFKEMKIPAGELKKLPIDLKKMEVTEINIFFDITKKDKFSSFFKGFKNEYNIVEHKSLDEYINNYKNNADFNGVFSEEISVPKGFNKEISKLLSDLSTRKNFFKEISKIIFPFRNLIKNEYDFQAVLDGIFCTYSDKYSNESIVLTEYQTGLGNRIDMIINKKRHPIIGLELKIIKEASKAKEMLETAEKQIKKYKKSVNYKVLDDAIINKTEFISVVFIRNPSSAEKLIKCGENTIPVEIKRSSIIDTLPGGDNAPPVPPAPRKRPRESLGKTQSKPKRPASADDKEKPEHMEPSTSQKPIEKIDIDANLAHQISSSSDSSDSVINLPAQVPDKPPFPGLTKPR